MHDSTFVGRRGHTRIGMLELAADGGGHVGSNSIHTPASHAEQATGCGSAPAAV